MISLSKGSKGQTVVEYILLLLVVTSLVTSFLSYIRVRYLGDIEKCTNAANQNTLLCKINSLITSPGEGKRFQYYPFKK